MLSASDMSAVKVLPKSHPYKDYHCLYRLVICGDSGVGKTSLLRRFVDEEYSTHTITIGVDFKIRTVELDGHRVKLQIWDTVPGRYRILSRSYYRGTKGILIVFDVTNQDTFDHVADWMEEVNSHCSATAHRLLVGNKSDMTDSRAVCFERAQEFADKEGIPYLETSAKNDANVEEAFIGLAQMILKHDAGQPSQSWPSLKLEQMVSRAHGCCCCGGSSSSNS